mgnify:CR=1 FL=1
MPESLLWAPRAWIDGRWEPGALLRIGASAFREALHKFL